MTYTRRRFIGSAATLSGVWLSGCGGGGGGGSVVPVVGGSSNAAQVQPQTQTQPETQAPVQAPVQAPTTTTQVATPISDASPAPETAPTPTPTPTPTPAAAPVPATLRGVLVQSGDSIAVGWGAGGHAAINHLGFGDGVALVNLGLTGRTLLTGYQLADEARRYHDPSVPSVLLIEQGTNDLSAGWEGETLYRTVAAPFVALARNAGFYVVLNTVLPRADDPWTAAKELQRRQYNALVRANAAGADVVNDIAADAEIGEANGKWLAYYPDGLHPGVAGQDRLALVTAAAIRPLFLLPPRTG